MANSADQDQLASEEGRVYPGSVGLGLRRILYTCNFDNSKELSIQLLKRDCIWMALYDIATGNR